ncbi:DUF364 domain-containing protein [bacterium]|nr:DUF364 domain-containing protein [bacterium]
MRKILAHWIEETLACFAVDRRVVDVRLGLKAVGVKLDDGTCGVAYRFTKDASCDDISRLGHESLAGRKASELLTWLRTENSLQRSVGLAVANALISPDLLKASANVKIVNGDVLSAIEIPTSERIAMIGYFEPMVDKIRKRCALEIYEFNTSMAPELRESSAAPEGLKRCDIALITSTTIVNGTIDRLLEAATDCREVVMLGPSTPLVPEAFAGTPVTLLSGVVVVDNEILRVVSEGGGMRRFKPYVRKVNIRLN